MTQNQLSQSGETRGAVNFPSTCQSFIEGYPTKLGEFFAYRETDAQSERMTVLLNGSIWEGESVEWFVFEHVRWIQDLAKRQTDITPATPKEGTHR